MNIIVTPALPMLHRVAEPLYADRSLACRNFSVRQAWVYINHCPALGAQRPKYIKPPAKESRPISGIKLGRSANTKETCGLRLDHLLGALEPHMLTEAPALGPETTKR